MNNDFDFDFDFDLCNTAHARSTAVTLDSYRAKVLQELDENIAGSKSTCTKEHNADAVLVGARVGNYWAKDWLQGNTFVRVKSTDKAKALQKVRALVAAKHADAALQKVLEANAKAALKRGR